MAETAIYRGAVVTIDCDEGGQQVRIRKGDGTFVWVWRKQLTERG